MIEWCITKVIQELGATGVMVVGFWWITQMNTKKIIASLKIINDELGQILKLAKEMNARQEAEKKNSQII